MVYIRDVAHVQDGFAVQTNIVAQNRVRSALLTVLKSASASTLDIIKPGESGVAADQGDLAARVGYHSTVRSVDLCAGLYQRRFEGGLIAACLTALMILLFLGSWRSTLVVATSIPFSILMLGHRS